MSEDSRTALHVSISFLGLDVVSQAQGVIVDEHLIRLKLALQEVGYIGIVLGNDTRPIILVVEGWIVRHKLEALYIQFEVVLKAPNVVDHNVVSDHLGICLTEIVRSMCQRDKANIRLFFQVQLVVSVKEAKASLAACHG